MYIVSCPTSGQYTTVYEGNKYNDWHAGGNTLTGFYLNSTFVVQCPCISDILMLCCKGYINMLAIFVFKISSYILESRPRIKW